jgi:hypothetical protein
MRTRALLLLPTLLLGCGGDPGGTPEDAYEPATLQAYLAALPAESRVRVGVPGAEDTSGALTQPGNAKLAAQGVAFGRAVNDPARELVSTLRAITAQPPTRYAARERKFVWGPWDNERGVGQLALVVSENDPGAAFKYAYALVRTMDGDLGSATPVIAGGATPDPAAPDYGAGVALWDLEANRAFDAAHDPDALEAEQGRGRFVMLFAHQFVDTGDAFFNVALFRNFVPERQRAAAAPAELRIDYFYGHFAGIDGVQADFLEAEIFADLCDASAASCFEENGLRDADESFTYAAFFVDRGLGRAEASLSNGDLPQAVRMIECWDDGLDRTFYQVENDGEVIETIQNGSCAPPTDRSAAELALPTLGDISPALRDVMSCAAENGLIGC